MGRLTSLVAAAAVAGLVAAQDHVELKLYPTPRTGVVPPNFASFSWEVSGALQMLSGDGATAPPRASLMNLLNNLRALDASGQGANIRVGGDSTDGSVYAPPSVPLPVNVTYRITGVDLAAYAAGAPLFNGTITAGVNFRNASAPAFAVAHTAALLATLPSGVLEAVEIGNECDLYAQNGIRAPDYNGSQYLAEWATYASALYNQTALRAPAIQGLTFCCHTLPVDAAIPAYENGEADAYASISMHYYPLNGRAVPPPTVAQLMANSSSAGVTALAPIAAAAAARGRRFVIGEGNSAYDGGAWGLSNAMASALWAVDTMFWAATMNASRFNFHGGPISAYTPIGYANASDPACPPIVNPLYYGMYLFSHAVANDSAVVTLETVSTTNPLIVSWATRSAAGIWRLVVLYKDPTATQLAGISVAPQTPYVHCNATLYTLQPASGNLSATTGLSYSGISFNTPDGLPAGTFNTTPVPLIKGAFYFPVPPASASILEFSSILC